MRKAATWHGLEGTDAINGLPGDEGWFYSDKLGIRANHDTEFWPRPGPLTEAALNQIRAKAEAGSEFHQRALMAHLKARLLT